MALSALRLGDPITDLITQAASSVVDRVVINTRYGPQVVLEPPQPAGEGGGGGGGAGGGGGGSSIAAALQPEILLYLKGQSDPISYAPYGEPGETQWGWMKFVALTFLGTVVYFTFKGVTRRK
jgi:hypothetical protein